MSFGRQLGKAAVTAAIRRQEQAKRDAERQALRDAKNEAKTKIKEAKAYIKWAEGAGDAAEAADGRQLLAQWEQRQNELGQ